MNLKLIVAGLATIFVAGNVIRIRSKKRNFDDLKLNDQHTIFDLFAFLGLFLLFIYLDELAGMLLSFLGIKK